MLLPTAKDRTEKPFAVAYIELMRADGTVLSDGTHDLLLYKVHNMKSTKLAFMSYETAQTRPSEHCLFD